jgi:hypothetical protein
MYGRKVKKRCENIRCPCRHKVEKDEIPSGGSLTPTIKINNANQTYHNIYSIKKITIPYVKSGYSMEGKNDIQYKTYHKLQFP